MKTANRKGDNMTKAEQAEKERALTTLREWLRPGDTVHCVLNHVSQSGMMREISLYKICGDDTRSLSRLASVALGYRLGKHGGLRIGGCGMDMGFAIVYDLAHTLWPDGFPCAGEQCLSNDHSNRETKTYHLDGGYALRHIWL